MLDFDKYTIKNEYPDNPKIPRLKSILASNNIDSYIESAEKFVEELKIYKIEVEEARRKRDEYQREENEKYILFMQDCLRDYGIEDNPKGEVAFGKAWQDGHADGYYSVYSCLSKYVDLIK